MKSIFKNTIFGIILAIHAVAICVINFSMPSYKALNITGIEVKRMDKDGFINKERVANGAVRDVYFIYTKTPQSIDDVISFRNEDTRWGYPFYMKFNSADLQAKAAALAESKSLVQIKYYGWRLPIFHEFFNAVSIKKIKSKDELSMPIFSYLFYFLTLVSLIYCLIFTNNKFKH
ncbi:DUF1523 family protein [Campylobacter mucosalis]|uniref:DUF1523 family protein n=1 Tax=Campylobacter mucosalis TaxID=202 RepID=UPI00147085A7|nr:DUF1523 family protein [Campylobacter mucosalis]